MSKSRSPMKYKTAPLKGIGVLQSHKHERSGHRADWDKEADEKYQDYLKLVD